MTKIKLQIKNRFTGSIIFEYEKEDNNIKETLLEALRQCADLRCADLRYAYLQGVKIKSAIVFSGLYTYYVMTYITENNEARIKMGCFDRSLKEWEDNFWNNNNEFPNNGSLKSNLRLMAFETAKKWIELKIKDNE